MPHKWPPGLPTRHTRVALDCGASGPQGAGEVIEDGPAVCMVRWDDGPVQAHPVDHLVPEPKA